MAADPIKIGSVLSVTGPAAFLGDPELKTLQMYVEDINKKGGVLGRNLELVHYDDGSDAGKANGFGKRLIDDDKVDIIVGGTTTGSTMSMVPLVEKAGVPFISLAGAVVIVEPVKKWVFKTPHTDRMAAEKVFEDMKKRGLTKVALFSESSGFGQSGKKETEAVAGKYGITLVANETYGPKDTDMSPQLTKIRNTPGVQAVFIFGLGQGPAIATKGYKQLGITLPLYHAHGVASDEFIKLAGPASEGVRLPLPRC
jgi:branched-chain amino acid transport system substrate-binding protein